MSVKVMGMVWDLEIDQRLKLVLLAYADKADHDGTDIYPSLGLVARMTGYSKRSVRRITRDLEELGYLVPEGKAGEEGYSTNKWHIPIRGGQIVPPDIAVSAPPDIAVSAPPDIAVSANPSINELEDSVSSLSVGESSKTKESSIDSRLKSSNGRKLTQSQLWVKVLCEICKMDPDVMAGRVAKRAKNLRDAGYTLEQIERLYAKGGWWYRYDFRGKKGQPPVPEQIEKTILRALDEEVRLAKANKKGDMVAQ